MIVSDVTHNTHKEVLPKGGKVVLMKKLTLIEKTAVYALLSSFELTDDLDREATICRAVKNIVNLDEALDWYFSGADKATKEAYEAMLEECTLGDLIAS